MSLIGQNEIHLLFVRDAEIKHPELIRACHQVLSPEESRQRDRFHFQKHQHQYLVTRALVRTALSWYTNGSIEPDDWSFVTNEYGKPRIEYPDCDLTFNISHTEGMVALALARGLDVGVDVEWLQRDGETVSLADRFFSPAEAHDLRSLAAYRQRERFFDLWTLKESYIKAWGMGLSIPLDQFSFSFPAPASGAAPGGINISFDERRNDDPAQWCFWQFQPDKDLKVALAAKRQSAHQDFRVSTFEMVPFGMPRELEYSVLRSNAAQYFRAL